MVVEEFAERVAAASRTAERVVAAFEGLGATLGDLGMSLIKVSSSPGMGQPNPESKNEK